MTDDSLPLNEQATATEDYEIIFQMNKPSHQSTSLYYMLD